jgi:uncharacterized protein (UPF0332 family)
LGFCDFKSEYAIYRIERANENLDVAIEMYEEDHYRIANNRVYYSICHSMRAVLAFDGFDSKKHSGIIAEFRKPYIKTGIFQEKLSTIIGRASEIIYALDMMICLLYQRRKRISRLRTQSFFMK